MIDVAGVEARTPELGAWSSTSTGEPFGEWELPGMGDPAPRCGEVSASTFCDEAGHIQFQRHLCGRRECPECWSSQWAGPRTASVVSRLAAARYAEEGVGRRVVHAVVSPPEDSINTIRGYFEGRRKANEIAKEHGVRGGVVVAHGYRALEETKQRFQEEEPDLPLWRWIRANDRPWKEQVYWSPHFHVIGLCRDFSAAEERSDGWVIQNLSTGDRRFSPFQLHQKDGYRDMVGAVRYLLSHATFPANESRQAVTWFGSLHGTNFDPEAELSAGSWSTIQRITEEVVGAGLEDDDGDGGGEEDDDRECPVEGCDGRVHDIWGARMFLESAAGEALERDQRERVEAAYEWVAGLKQPPPGMKNPQSEEQAREALSVILEGEA